MARAIRGIAGIACLLLLAPAALGQNDAVKKSIERGVAALKNGPTLRGENRYEIGAVALVGITLLECEVPANDPAVQKAALDLRKAAPEMVNTYSISLTILFLDRLGDPGDIPLIQALAIRLLAGQNRAGGWTYTCPRPSDDEIRRLKERPRTTDTPKPPVGSTDKPLFPFEKRKTITLPVDMQKQVDQINQPGQPGQFPAGLGEGDNSNTQFATMAVWVARRYGVPTEDALARIEARFRASQNPDGGWGYTPRTPNAPAMNSSAGMTCAGLLGLAVGHGSGTELRTRDPKAKPVAVRPHADPGKDPAVRAGFIALSTSIDLAARGRIERGHYFLWSLERVAMVYGLNNIAGKDWYAWGATLLLASQGADGAWQGEYSPCVDTSFALLFLRKSNLARDLTNHLKGKVELKAGGVGGDGVAKLKPGVTDKPAPKTEAGGAEVARLRDDLLRAPAAQRDKVIERLRDSKGSVYTQALVSALPHLDDANRKLVRQALAERLTRMTAGTLRDMLKDEDPEMRRAAALACGMKDDKVHVPDLIALVEDPESFVIRAVRASLKSLTSQDFGPAPDASAADRAKAAAAWREWWAKQNK